MYRGKQSPKLRHYTCPSKGTKCFKLFAHGSYQTSVGEINILGQSQPTVSRSLEMVCSLILERLTPLWIKFPMTRQEKESTMQGFQDMYGIPHTLGAKGYYSINCQMICDAKSRITSVNPNFPGSTHDAAIWQSSNVHQYLKDQYVDHRPMEWLLGDKGYPLLPWLMTPLAEVGAGTPEERYNKMHSHARVVIEMTFGRLKNIFRCLNRHRTLHYSPEKAAKIVISCCTIHNILIWSGIIPLVIKMCALKTNIVKGHDGKGHLGKDILGKGHSGKATFWEKDILGKEILELKGFPWAWDL
ncbi:DDE superfamily endonuclease domain-containing protein [Phthorimaea operculella]|nr:DDE superfamily endonuclease domain-containing protein [Phthorimaea operculella]